MKFTVMYKARPEDAVVVMDAAVDSLSSLYRVVYAMAGKVRNIGSFETFIAHQKLPNGDVIEMDKAGFTRAIRAARETMDDDARDESASLSATSRELTPVNTMPPLMPTKKSAFNHKFFSVLPVKEAKWSVSHESFVR